MSIGEHLLLRSTLRLAVKPGIAHDERNADARLVHRALVDHAVLAFEQAVVAHEDDDRVVELPGSFEQRVRAGRRCRRR